MKVNVLNASGMDKLKVYNRKLRENGFSVGICIRRVGFEGHFQMEVDRLEDFDKMDEIFGCDYEVIRDSEGTWEICVID